MQVGQYIIKKDTNNLTNFQNGTLTFRYPVSHLGIQGRPGIAFVINNSNWDITIGNTGVYELNLEGMGRIKTVSFNLDEFTLEDKVIVDFVMEEG